MDFTPQEVAVLGHLREVIAQSPYSEQYVTVHIQPMDGDNSYLITAHTLTPKPVYALQKTFHTIFDEIKKGVVDEKQHLFLLRLEDGGGLLTLYECCDQVK